MNRLRDPHTPVFVGENPSDTDATNPTQPRGTRDACPMGLRPVGYAPTSTEESLSRRSLKGEAGWGSRLGYREGGRPPLVPSCRPADNPFASHRLEGLPYRQTGSSPEDLVPRLIELGGRAAIVGPQGSGKTTLLEELAHILPADSVMVRLPGGCRHPWRTTRAQLPIPVRASHAVLIDGAEQLGRIGWSRLVSATSHAGFLVATLHRPGVLPTLIECRVDRALLGELVSELEPAGAPSLEPGLGALFERHEGNIRLCLRELYDVYAGRASNSEL